ncbi:MAG: GAF domain-containing protein [Solirubrobacteraceae bacterium]
MATADPGSSDQEVLDALAAFAAAKERDVIARALDAARERLRMDTAYVSTVTPEIQRVDRVAGASAPLGFVAGTTAPFAQTYCSRMLTGEIPNLIPDSRADPALRDLPFTATIGSYAGVPIRLADGRVHGTLCCASGEATTTTLGPDELHFLEVLATIVAAEIDRTEGSRSEAADRLLHRSSAPHPPPGP